MKRKMLYQETFDLLSFEIEDDSSETIVFKVESPDNSIGRIIDKDNLKHIIDFLSEVLEEIK